MDMDFCFNVECMPDYDWTAGVFAFWYISATFYYDKPFGPATDRIDNSCQPAHTCIAQYGHLSSDIDMVYRESCQSAD